jgi:hypothetical protein
MRKGFVKTTVEHFGRYCWASFAVLCLIIVLAVVFASLQWPYFEAHPERFVLAGLIAFMATIVPPVVRMARHRNKHMLLVAVWGVVITGTFLAATYATFFLYVGDSVQLQQKYQPILALGPVISGLMLAAIGWYIHYQKTSKDERTAAAFKILMETRTSSEFLRYQRELRIVFPSGVRVQPSQTHLFPPAAARLEAEKVVQLETETDKSVRAALRADISLLKALDALSYLLNHYEFVAQAIRAGDLDEELLYETVSPWVVDLYERGTVFVEHVQQREPLAFQHLKKLVHSWRQRLRQEEADVLNASGSDSGN